MKSRDELARKIENYINNGRLFEIDDDNNNLDRFYSKCASRVVKNYEMFERNNKYIGDFLLSLRDFLLVYKEGLQLHINFEKQLLDTYSIWKDKDTGTFSASYALPSYVNKNFVQTAFLSNYEENKLTKTDYNLSTDLFIQQLTGYNKYKTESQKLAVHGALNTPSGYTSLISLPTGGGKSLITQSVAYQYEGLTIVIVPTVSLAIDQERSAKKVIKSDHKDEEIFFYSSGVDQTSIINAIRNRTAKLLFVSPETLFINSSFKEVIADANKQNYLRNIVIDEAHIVADWGALFRVDYQCLEAWRKDLIYENSRIRTYLLSATYEDECVKLLKDFFCTNNQWIEIRCDELRKEPQYILIKATSNKDKDSKVLELVRKLPHPMIIYVSNPYEANCMLKKLENAGLKNAKTFTGETTFKERKTLIQKWINNDFEIMIATSAFGVGVDKDDVRSVIHTYIPQNANTYYQELGRGGRDRLPCLSVMCINFKTDYASTFQKINKRVMTTEKICKRWIAMFNNMKSVRKSNHIIIDTSIKPSYLNIEENEEIEYFTKVKNIDMNWNIYVLLFLRRYNFLQIKSVIYDNYVYKFQITDVHPVLQCDQVDDENLIAEIEKCREKEYQDYLRGLNELRNAIKNYDHICWSEMFCNTYTCVDEYCSGCGTHKNIISDYRRMSTLKKAIKSPLQPFNRPYRLFSNNDDIVILESDELRRQKILYEFIKNGISTLVTEENIMKLIDFSNIKERYKPFMLLNRNELIELTNKSNYFYISGYMIILYPKEKSLCFQYIKTIIKHKNKLKNCKLIHIMHEHYYIENLGKKYSDLINGPVYSCGNFKIE